MNQTTPKMTAASAVASGHLVMVNPQTRKLMEKAITGNTRRAYQGALSRLDEWLNDRQLDDSSLAEYVQYLHSAGKAPNTISLAVAAAVFRARLVDAPSPVGALATIALRAARRDSKGRGRGQVAGINWQAADATVAVAANGGASLAGLRDAALIALGSDAMLRVSELAALLVTDLQHEPDGTGRLTIQRSKTDPDGEGVVLYVGGPTMARLNRWTDQAGIRDGVLFRRIRRGGAIQVTGLTARSIREIIRRRGEDAGIDGRVSGHSLRVGSAQSLATAGASLAEMQIAGRWKDARMPAHYARGELAGRGAVARLRYGK